MKSLVSRCALGISVGAAMLAGCGVFPFDSAQGRLAQDDTHKPWMLAEARKIKKLLYVSDQATDYVYVYKYGGKKDQVGRLTGFRQPDGQCVDAQGDVWITDTLSSAVVEYAHGRSEPMATLSTGDGNDPIGCSVAPNGDLAVVNSPNGSAPGNVEVFQNASGSATVYTDSGGCDLMFSPGYDLNDNLYVQGESKSYIGVCELPAGGSSLAPVGTGDVNLNYPGSVMWDGKYIALTQPDYMSSGHTVIFQMSENASGSLTEQYEITLKDDCSASFELTYQPFIVGKKNTPSNKYEGFAVVGGNLDCSNRVAFWAYPAGGEPLSALPSAPAEPSGQSVSIGSRSPATGN
jgi:hypothetical protein